MRPRDWFEVGARLIGLWVFTVAIDDAFNVAVIVFNAWSPKTTPTSFYWVRLAQHSIVGASLLLLAGLMTDLLFGRLERSCAESPAQSKSPASE